MKITIETPIIVGAAQYTQGKKAIPALDPLSLMNIAAKNALFDAGLWGRFCFIDAICIVNIFSWVYTDPAESLAASLGISTPVHKYYSPIGGNAPQMFVNHCARAIATGQYRAVLIAGAEAAYALSRAGRGLVNLNWPSNDGIERLGGCSVNSNALLWHGYTAEMASKKTPPALNEIESTYNLFMPQYMYPLFETSLRGALGWDQEVHRGRMAQICAYLSEVAAHNPYAWQQKAKTGQSIITPTPNNRYIGFPYTKHMTANLYVDQAAAIVMTNETDAKNAGIPPGQWIYPQGGADLSNVWFVSQRPYLYDSPAITQAANLALDQAGLTIDDLDMFDLYSCFPSAFEIARRALGISEDDSRDLSVTGGLPYFGGPGNNYSLHAIVEMIHRIRRNRSLQGMVTANGFYNTKHSVGIYGTKPPKYAWEKRDDSGVQRLIDDSALPPPVERAEGMLTILAYVICHTNDGIPNMGTVIGVLPNGQRALANIDANPHELEIMEKTPLEGRVGEVRFDHRTARNLLRL